MENNKLIGLLPNNNLNDNNIKFLKEHEFYSKNQLIELNSLKYKKRLISKVLNIYGMLIIFLSLLYLDEIVFFKDEKKTRKRYLLIISFLTIFYTLFKILHNFYKIKLKRKISKKISLSIFEKHYILTFIIFIIHPNIFLDNYEIYATYKIPNKFYLTPINYFPIIFQTTTILFQFLKNLITNSNLISKKGEYITRKYSEHLNFFHLKHYFKKKPLKLLSIFIIIFILELSILLKIFEAPISKNQDEFSLIFWSNIFWTNFITMLTVGYGHSIPETLFGRFIVVIAGIGGHLFFSSMIVAFSDFMKFDEVEYGVYNSLERYRLESDLRECSREIVFRLVRAFGRFKGEDEKGYQEDKNFIEKRIGEYKILKERFYYRKYLRRLMEVKN